MSQVKRVLYNMEESRKTILALTGITQDELSEMQFLCAFECLERIIGKDEYGKQQLPQTSKFWDWWKDQWYRRDRVFLDRLVYDTEIMMYTVRVPQYDFPLAVKNEEAMRTAYKCYHRIDPDNNLINSSVVEYSFRNLVRQSKQ